ncbi:MAG: aromatic amino acid hydroxylase [Flavobacteriaceae bacterium]
MVENDILKQLPQHLRQYIKPQNYQNYTSIDQAVWRYTFRKNKAFLTKHAHKSYAKGLLQAGLKENQIPSLYGMNRILKDIGWAAVAVDGFIPPAAFMEFQAYNVLVIASDIRQLQHIEYTPAPDIIHESAGHSPMLVNLEYSAFLQRFGELGSKAIGSFHNNEVYQAVRELSILEEKTNVDPEKLSLAREKVFHLQNKKVEPSEMDELRNLHWWTVEYGLIGTEKHFKLYGAGLLSSIGESKWCLSKDVLKLPFTLEAKNQNFDITKPQPQLYVTPNFSHLSKVLEEFANGMSLRKGGINGLKKLIKSNAIGTIELSTGLQISGHFTHCIDNPFSPNEVAYFQTMASTALAYRNQELIGHSTKKHPNGFGSPVGKLKGTNLAIEDMTPSDLEKFNIVEGNTINLLFQSGVEVKGKIISGRRNIFGKIMLISFSFCTVRFQDQVLFQPSWGQYDMAIGKNISSVYAGPADSFNFPFVKHTPKTSDPVIASPYEKLYKEIAAFKKNANLTSKQIDTIGERILVISPSQWLVILDFYEAVYDQNNQKWEKLILDHLKLLADNNPAFTHLINDGIKLIHNSK